MRIFKWRQSHFTLVDQYTVTSMYDLRMCEAADGKIILMVVGSDTADEVNAASMQPLTLTQVYVFENDRLTHVQNLHTQWSTLYTFTIDRRCELTAMPDRQRPGSALLKAETYTWDYQFHLRADQASVLYDAMATNEYDLIVVQSRDNLTAFTEQGYRRGQSSERRMPAGGRLLMLASVDEQLFVAVLKKRENATSLTYNVHLMPVRVERQSERTGVADVGAANPSQASEDCFEELSKSIADRQATIDELAKSVSGGLYTACQMSHYIGTIN